MKKQKKNLIDLPRRALSKSRKMVPLPRALSAKLKKMVDLPRARARALGKGAISMEKNPALPRASDLALSKVLIKKKNYFAESSTESSRQRGFQKKYISLLRDS